MSLRFYDEAITSKISKWIKDPNLKLLKPDESTRLFEMKLDEQKDNPLTLPLISISRDRNVEILNVQKQPKTFDGYVINTGSVKHINLNVIPIDVTYQIDIYTKGLAEADEYIRNFVFNLINYPKVEIDIPYNNVNIKHISNINLETTITDNSDIKEHLFPDQFVRFTLRFKIDDAYFFSAAANDNTILDLGMEVQDSQTKEIVETYEINS